MNDRRPLAALACAPLALLAWACTSPSEKTPEPSPQDAAAAAEAAATPAPWTASFLEPAVLVAREVSIEGPPGLLEHFAVNVDPAVHDYVVLTVPEGLRQDVTVKEGASGALIRCQLDQLVIACEQRVRVLERPGRVPVTVIAVGDASWSTPGGAEKRGQTLRFVGQEPR